MSEVRILIIDDDKAGQMALQQILDSEGWRIQVQPLASEVLSELAREEWTLLLVNPAMTGLSGSIFATLKDLAQARAVAGDKRRVRVLFLVPEVLATRAQPLLESERLPYVLKPIHMHDFLEKVSDLLLEAEAISQPIRRVRSEHKGRERRSKDRRTTPDRRRTAMFASREDYYMTEEEIAEFEKEEEERRKKEKEKEKRRF